MCYQPRQKQKVVNKYVTFAYQNSNHKNSKQSTHIIREHLHALKIYTSFRSSHIVLHLCYVTCQFVVCDWKNLQNEKLYTLIPVRISCCTFTATICPFSEMYIKFQMEQIHYRWAAKVCFLLASTNKSHIKQSADGSHLATTIFESKGAISNGIEAKSI